MFVYLAVRLREESERNGNTCMGMVPHDGKFSPNVGKPHRIDLICFPLVGRSRECFGSDILPISRPDGSVNYPVGTFTHGFVNVINQPLSGGRGFAWCLSRRRTLQIQCLYWRIIYLGLPGLLDAPFKECFQVIHIARIAC